MLKLHRSLLDRIEKLLSRYKNEICGTEQCNFEDELYSELSKTHISFRENRIIRIRIYKWKKKAKILEFVKSKIYDLAIPLCKLFYVGDEYDNQDSHEIYKRYEKLYLF